MTRPLVECVPNFSEGRDPARVDALAAAIASVHGVRILGRHADPDHHRSVVTFAGPPEEIVEAAVRGVGKAVDLIDLNRHRGGHPRLGAADVVPFVPLAGVSLADCAVIAGRAGQEIWRRFHLPVYYYEAAARRPDRVPLERIRLGQFEGLRMEAPRNPSRAPDVGGPELHPTAGAVAVGARKLLIAYNVQLATADLAVARRLARAVRASAGGLPAVKAMAVALPSQAAVQVSMNLTDYEITPPARAFAEIARLAAAEGVGVACSEFVGLVPRAALAGTSPESLRCATFHSGLLLENRLEEAFGAGAIE